MRITYSLRLLVAPTNIDKYNDNVNNTKEYKYMRLRNVFFVISGILVHLLLVEQTANCAANNINTMTT